MNEWLDSARQYLITEWGLNENFAKKIALLLAYLYSYGLSPRISSGFRDPVKQRQMQAAWDSGNRAGLRARPATNSLHIKTGFLGKPASEAIDITSSNPYYAALIAKQLGIRPGYFFKTPDVVHFDSGSGAEEKDTTLGKINNFLGSILDVVKPI
jgi:hypothetical protein